MIFGTASEQRAFLSMLFRLTEFEGVVRIDGVDILKVQKDKLRDKVAYISQVISNGVITNFQTVFNLYLYNVFMIF